MTETCKYFELKYYFVVYWQPKKTVTMSKDPNVAQSQQEEDDLAKGMLPWLLWF